MIKRKSRLGFAFLPLLAALLAPTAFGQQDVGAVKPSGLGHEKASKIVGKDVKNKERESLGEVQDLVFNKDGRIAYAVLSFGGFLGLGEKYFAIPWESLTPGPDKTFTLDIDKDRLSRAPGFDKKSWPNMADPGWSTEVDRFYAPKNAPDKSWGGKADSLKTAAINNPAGTKIGSVEDIIVDLDHGRATMVIMHTEKTVEPKDRWVAIPWNSMTVAPEKDTFTLNAGESTLAQAPNFGKDKWPDMDRSFTKQVYRHFGRDLDTEIPAGHVWAPANVPGETPACCRSTEMVGAACRTSSNENLGTIKDLVFTSDRGRIAFLILDTTADDGKFRAIPWSLCRFTKGGGCVISCDAATLKSAPTFPEKEWPDFNDIKWQESIFSHFDVKG